MVRLKDSGLAQHELNYNDSGIWISLFRLALIYNSDRPVHIALLSHIEQFGRSQLVDPRGLLFKVLPALDPRLVDIDKPQDNHGEDA